MGQKSQKLQIANLYNRGVRIVDICNRLDVSRSAVYAAVGGHSRYVSAPGYSVPRLVADLYGEEILAAMAAGGSYREIAAVIGVSGYFLSQARSLLGGADRVCIKDSSHEARANALVDLKTAVAAKGYLGDRAVLRSLQVANEAARTSQVLANLTESSGPGEESTSQPEVTDLDLARVLLENEKILRAMTLVYLFKHGGYNSLRKAGAVLGVSRETVRNEFSILGFKPE